MPKIQYVMEAVQTELSDPKALVLSLYGCPDESPLLYLLAALKLDLDPKPSTKVNLALCAIEAASTAVAGQDPLWKQAASRLSGDMADFGVLMAQRAENAYRLPNLLAEVFDLTPKLTLLIFEGAATCPKIKQYLAPLEKALGMCKNPPTVIVSEV